MITPRRKRHYESAVKALEANRHLDDDGIPREFRDGNLREAGANARRRLGVCRRRGHVDPAHFSGGLEAERRLERRKIAGDRAARSETALRGPERRLRVVTREHDGERRCSDSAVFRSGGALLRLLGACVLCFRRWRRAVLARDLRDARAVAIEDFFGAVAVGVARARPCGGLSAARRLHLGIAELLHRDVLLVANELPGGLPARELGGLMVGADACAAGQTGDAKRCDQAHA